jgi:hypothetical protein
MPSIKDRLKALQDSEPVEDWSSAVQALVGDLSPDDPRVAALEALMRDPEAQKSIFNPIARDTAAKRDMYDDAPVNLYKGIPGSPDMPSAQDIYTALKPGKGYEKTAREVAFRKLYGQEAFNKLRRPRGDVPIPYPRRPDLDYDDFEYQPSTDFPLGTLKASDYLRRRDAMQAEIDDYASDAKTLGITDKGRSLEDPGYDDELRMLYGFVDPEERKKLSVSHGTEYERTLGGRGTGPMPGTHIVIQDVERDIAQQMIDDILSGYELTGGY